ncbi:MAG: hypothetical protein ACRDTA_16600 [Pseudonocardiaceae bacterium]
MTLSNYAKENRRLPSGAGDEEELENVGAAVLDDVCRVLAQPGSESDSAELRNAKELSRVVEGFFSKTKTEAFPQLVSVLETRREYVHKVVVLKEVMTVFRRDFVAISRVGSGDFADGRLRTSAAGVLQQMKEVIEVYERIVADDCEGDVWQRARDILREVDDGLAGYDLVYAERVEEASVKPGEKTGSVALGEFFISRGVSERKFANWLRAGAAFLLVLITVLAAWILFLSPPDSDTLGREFARLSTTVPLAVLAGYLSREASRHRNTADRSGELGAHLKHLDDYIVKLSEEEGRRYRYELGQSAYAPDKHGVSTADSPNSPGLVEEVARLAEAIKGLAPR